MSLNFMSQISLQVHTFGLFGQPEGTRLNKSHIKQCYSRTYGICLSVRIARCINK
jgi:hypothetical protein